jgi:hypothetical protein
MSIPIVVRILGTTAGCGVALIGLVAQPAAALGGVMVAVFVGGGMALRLYERPGTDARTRRRSVVTAGGTALSVWLVGTGVLVLLGPSLQSALIAILLVGVPAAVHLWRRFRLPAEPATPPVQLPAVVPSPMLGTLSTPELCLAWRRSYLTLVDLPAGPARVEIVAVRQSMLDELERRDSDGFHRWLDAGARAGGDPGRYLATGDGG